MLKCPYKSKPEENKEKEHLHYGNTVDSWAVGVLVYELLVGCPPFYDKSKSNTEARIVSGVPHFPPTISEAAKNFICAGAWLCLLSGPKAWMHKTHGCMRLADVATTTQLSSTVVDCPAASSCVDKLLHVC